MSTTYCKVEVLNWLGEWTGAIASISCAGSIVMRDDSFRLCSAQNLSGWRDDMRNKRNVWDKMAPESQRSIGRLGLTNISFIAVKKTFSISFWTMLSHPSRNRPNFGQKRYAKPMSARKSSKEYLRAVTFHRDKTTRDIQPLPMTARTPLYGQPRYVGLHELWRELGSNCPWRVLFSILM
jgi:hypothetical protein